MAYFSRVLTTARDAVPIARLRRALENKRLAATLAGDSEGGWASLSLSGGDGVSIARIEFRPVTAKSLGAADLRQFAAELERASPSTNAEWVRGFFHCVRSIYLIEHHAGAGTEEGYAALTAVREALWRYAPAIIQADEEGFTNVDGFQVTWEFGSKPRGVWAMAILGSPKPSENAVKQASALKWVSFPMDLGHAGNSLQFRRGEAPSELVPVDNTPTFWITATAVTLLGLYGAWWGTKFLPGPGAWPLMGFGLGFGLGVPAFVIIRGVLNRKRLRMPPRPLPHGYLRS